jgi:hypothetical protein
MTEESKKTAQPLTVDTHKESRSVLNVEWLGLVPGSVGRWNAIDEVQQGPQSFKVGHVEGVESSVVQMTCNDEKGKPLTYTIPTDKYNEAIGDANWQTSARFNLGEGAFISEALKKATGLNPDQLREKLIEPPYKAVFDKTNIDAMDAICASPQATAIKNSPDTTSRSK